MVVSRHNRLLTSILSHCRGHLDLSVKNGGGLTEVNPYERDPLFSLAVTFLSIVTGNSFLITKTPLKPSRNHFQSIWCYNFGSGMPIYGNSLSRWVALKRAECVSIICVILLAFEDILRKTEYLTHSKKYERLETDWYSNPNFRKLKSYELTLGQIHKLLWLYNTHMC